MSLETIVFVLIREVDKHFHFRIGISSYVPLEASFTSVKKITKTTSNKNIRENSSYREGGNSNELS